MHFCQADAALVRGTEFITFVVPLFLNMIAYMYTHIHTYTHQTSRESFRPARTFRHSNLFIRWTLPSFATGSFVRLLLARLSFQVLKGEVFTHTHTRTHTHCPPPQHTHGTTLNRVCLLVELYSHSNGRRPCSVTAVWTQSLSDRFPWTFSLL